MAEAVARHLVAAGVLVDEDPDEALRHARYARRRASRIAVVREAAGITAYHAGEWAEALADLRAARRMGGGPGHLAVMADIERALGRPERALDLARGPEVKELGRAAQIELAVVAAGARRDLGELDAAVVGLQIPELDPARRDPWSARLFYAYADNLLAAGRESDAVQWFVHAVDADEAGQTDAAVRLAELTGEEEPDDDQIEFGVEELAEAPEVEVEDGEGAAGPGPAAPAATGVIDDTSADDLTAAEPTEDASSVAAAAAPEPGPVPVEDGSTVVPAAAPEPGPVPVEDRSTVVAATPAPEADDQVADDDPAGDGVAGHGADGAAEADGR